MTRKHYHREILRIYRQLPDTPERFHRGDRNVVNQLFEQGVELLTVEAALLIATARRTCRDHNLDRLAPIRSIAYFLPIITEIPHSPPPDGYLDYLRSRLGLSTPTTLRQPQSHSDALSRNR